MAGKWVTYRAWASAQPQQPTFVRSLSISRRELRSRRRTVPICLTACFALTAEVRKRESLDRGVVAHVLLYAAEMRGRAFREAGSARDVSAHVVAGGGQCGRVLIA